MAVISFFLRVLQDNRHILTMVYKLYGHPMSTCANRVLIVAKEVGIDLEWHTVDLFKGEQKSEDFLKHQSFGKVPYLADTDEGLELYE